MPGRSIAERRVDPTDGKAYLKSEFEECYGGLAEWDKATRVGGSASSSPTAAGEKLSSQAAPPPRLSAKNTASANEKSDAKPASPQQEYRRDPSDGQAYTKQDFLDCYGGSAEWEKATIVSGAAQKERRTDPSDGRQYTKEDFKACYGGYKEWDAAAPKEKKVEPKKANMEPKKANPEPKKANPPPTLSEKRRDTDGKMYTRSEFVECYGGSKEWDAAGRKTEKTERQQRAPKARAVDSMEDDAITALCEQRQEARRGRDFKRADELRDQLRNLGVRIEDDARKWFVGNRSGEWTKGESSKGDKGNRRGNTGGKGSRGSQQSAWTAGLAQEEQRKHREDAASWVASEGSATLTNVFPSPPNLDKLEAFLTNNQDFKLHEKLLILVSLPLENFWGFLGSSLASRRYIAERIVAEVEGAHSDPAIRFLARLALHSEKLDSKFSTQSYAAAFCTTIFSLENLCDLARTAAKVTLLKETICAVLIACHQHYFHGMNRGAFGTFLREVHAEMWRVVFSSTWPAAAKDIAAMRRLLVSRLWPLLKVAPFMVRCMAPVSDWAEVLTVFYEVPLVALHEKTDGKVGADLCTAVLDVMRLLLQFYPFPIVEEGEGDFGYPAQRIEAALHQGMRTFSLISPVLVDRVPQTFATLLNKTYGSEGAQSFLMFEVLSKLHQHTRDVLDSSASVAKEAEQRKGAGKGKASNSSAKIVHIGASAVGKFVTDLVCVYKMDEGLFRDASVMGVLAYDEMDTLCSIVAGVLHEPRKNAAPSTSSAPVASPNGADFPDAFPEDCDTLLSIAGESGLVKSQWHAFSVLKFYDMNLENAIAAVFDSNLPPHLAEDTKPAGLSGGGTGPGCCDVPQASSSSSSSATVSPKKAARAPPVNPVTNPERFAKFSEMRKNQKLSKEEEFDEMMRARVVQYVYLSPLRCVCVRHIHLHVFFFFSRVTTLVMLRPYDEKHMNSI